MWCDNFDIDLPKVVPSSREALGAIGEIDLVTHGGITDGKLNHPSVWNHDLGMVAFFGRSHPHKPSGFVTSEPIVKCTLWEAIRDSWIHGVTILFEGRPVFNGFDLRAHFDALMWHFRGWRKLDNEQVLLHQVQVLDAIVNCSAAVDALCGIKR